MISKKTIINNIIVKIILIILIIMKSEILIFGLTLFFVANIYHEGKYVDLLKTWKKYYQMAFVGFLGLSTYLFIKKNPVQGKNLFVSANNLIKYMPIDKEAGDLLSPLLDLTSNSYFKKEIKPIGNNINNGLNNQNSGFNNFNTNYDTNYNLSSNQKKVISSGKTSTKRSVSETKKKFVASQQGWNCGGCHNQLNAWFEVDHKVRLEYGGSNEIGNLVALCRECHGEKTTRENL